MGDCVSVLWDGREMIAPRILMTVTLATVKMEALALYAAHSPLSLFNLVCVHTSHRMNLMVSTVPVPLASPATTVPSTLMTV